MVSRKKNQGLPSIRVCVTTVYRFWGELQGILFYLFLSFQLENERIDNGILSRKGDGKYLDYRKNLLSDPGGQIFCSFWVECNISHHRPK